MTKTHDLILCADDYAETQGVCDGIIQLLQRERLTAVSCLVTSPIWESAAEQLKPYCDKVDIGLHLNFTQAPLLTRKAFPLPQLLLRSHLGLLSYSACYRECCAQIERFMNVMGRAPDFIDGHQHVHQFPVIRRALINAYLKFFPEKKVYCRWVRTHLNSFNLKHWVTWLSGTWRWGQLLRKHNIPHNRDFAGLHGLNNSDYRSVFKNECRRLPKGGLMMCHPGLEGGARDQLVKERERQMQYLLSPEMLEDCAAAGLRLSRFNDAGHELEGGYKND